MIKPLVAGAALELVLILPATLFMAALIIRNLPLSEMANGAQWFVMWYSTRVWTLWVLLLALPFAALIAGCVMLSRDRIERPQAAAAIAPAQPASIFIVVLTLSAAGILAIVVLHMLAH